MKRRLDFRPGAEADLDGIYEYIASDSPERAIGFVRMIRARCAKLTDFAEIGGVRQSLGPDLRALNLERRVSVVYRLDAERVEIVRVFYGGRNVEALMLGAEDESKD